ncbi:MAG: hypothetical protein M0021_09630 [Clostridia bacterium]|nr:hypothetical protein [Clostridia bacterium]
MSVCLDHFSRPLHQESLRRMNTCLNCDGVIPVERNYCPECAYENWADSIANLSLEKFCQKLDDLFDGEEQRTVVTDARVEITYLCKNPERLGIAEELLKAYGATEFVVTRESVSYSIKPKHRGKGCAEIDIA